MRTHGTQSICCETRLLFFFVLLLISVASPLGKQRSWSSWSWRIAYTECLNQWGYVLARTVAFLLECCIDSSSGAAVAKAAVRPGVVIRGDLRARSACGRHFFILSL